MTQIVIVNGYAQSGKDSFVNYCCDYLKKKENSGIVGWKISTVEDVKRIAKIFGWNGDKTPEWRKWLSDCKDFLTENGDLIFKLIQRKIDDIITLKIDKNDDLIFIFSREPKEIQRFVEYYDATTVFVWREESRIKAETELDNHADLEVQNYQYDYVIDNNGDLDCLRITAINFVNEITKRSK